METIKDYLHLYLGCECIADGVKFVLHGVERTDTGTLAYDGTMIDGIHQCWWIENCDFKLFLRSLNSITEKEKLELKPISDNWNAGVDLKFSNGVYDYTHWFAPSKFLWALSKHFDLFGLIEKGLAIDTTKIKQTN